MKKSTKRYETPQVEIIALEKLSVLCASGGGTSKGAGTTSMDMYEVSEITYFVIP